MEYHTYKCGPFNIHIIKTDRFRTTHMEVIFRCEAKKEKLQSRSLLSDIITHCSKKYHTKRELSISEEELYTPYMYGLANKTGNVLNTIFINDFISPEYIEDANYYRNVLSLFFDLLMNPYVINNEFDIKNYNIYKEYFRLDIESIKNSPVKQSIYKALKLAFPDSITSELMEGTLEALEELTPGKIYDAYVDMLQNDLCDIFIIGNVDEEETVRIIKENFTLKSIKNYSLEYSVNNKSVNKPIVKEDESDFNQASLELIYNIGSLTDIEKHIHFHVFNYIFGSGGITSKLYQEVREKNSLCYGISSMYMKYDRVLMTQVSLNGENTEKAIKLIKKCLKDMCQGNFTDEDLDNAKTNLIRSLKMSLDSQNSIINNYVFHVFNNLPSIEDRIEMVKKVTKEDVINVAKKLKLNTIYNLNGGQNGKN